MNLDGDEDLGHTFLLYSHILQVHVSFLTDTHMI